MTRARDTNHETETHRADEVEETEPKTPGGREIFFFGRETARESLPLRGESQTGNRAGVPPERLMAASLEAAYRYYYSLTVRQCSSSTRGLERRELTVRQSSFGLPRWSQ